jgi:hypothetical protein
MSRVRSPKSIGAVVELTLGNAPTANYQFFWDISQQKQLRKLKQYTIW